MLQPFKYLKYHRYIMKQMIQPSADNSYIIGQMFADEIAQTLQARKDILSNICNELDIEVVA